MTAEAECWQNVAVVVAGKKVVAAEAASEEGMGAAVLVPVAVAPAALEPTAPESAPAPTDCLLPQCPSSLCVHPLLPMAIWTEALSQCWRTLQ